MENQHRKITGYRELDAAEIAEMNQIKALAEQTGSLIESLVSADGRWKAVWIEPPHGPRDGHWQLFDIQADRAENNDLSARHPDIVARLVQRWKDYMAQVGGVNPVRPASFY